MSSGAPVAAAGEKKPAEAAATTHAIGQWRRDGQRLLDQLDGEIELAERHLGELRKRRAPVARALGVYDGPLAGETGAEDGERGCCGETPGANLGCCPDQVARGG